MRFLVETDNAVDIERLEEIIQYGVAEVYGDSNATTLYVYELED